MTSAQGPVIPARRTAMLGLGATLLAGRASAQSRPEDLSLRRVVRSGQLRFVLSPSMLNLPSPIQGLHQPLDDPFGRRLGQVMAEVLGVRAVQLPGARAGQGPQLLEAGEVDVVVGAPFSRFAMGLMQLCPPVLIQDIVILGPDGAPRRRMVQWTGRPLGVLGPMAQIVAERGQPLELARSTPFPDLRQAEAALQAGEVEGLLLAAHQAQALRARRPQAGWVVRTTLVPVAFAPAVARSAHDLLLALRQVVLGLHADGSLAALQQIYMPGALVPLPHG